MDNTQTVGAMSGLERDRSQDKRIRDLELQVHTLTAAVQHLMHVTKPLIELAQQARESFDVKIYTGQ